MGYQSQASALRTRVDAGLRDCEDASASGSFEGVVEGLQVCVEPLDESFAGAL